MIEVILRGQLGNWLFQYALGRRLARKHGVTLTLNTSHLARHARQQAHRMLASVTPGAHIAHRVPLLRRAAQALGRASRLNEQGWGFDAAFLQAPADCTLYGYFQSERYFDAPDALRSDLRAGICSGHDGAHHALFAEVTQGQATAMHVRRGDYLTSKPHAQCSLDYYARAMAKVRERVPDARFYVFSDDLPWCRTQPQFSGAVFVDIPGATHNPLIDLDLMSRCKHHVIANSTFSWWGAWLAAPASAEHVVIAPDAWFTKPKANAAAMRDTIAEGWLKLPAAGSAT